MSPIARRTVVGLCLVVAAGLSVSNQRASAQQSNGGFDLTLGATPRGAEITSQDGLWVMEVRFKPIRMIRVAVTDPQTKEQRNELIWYMVYRTINRPISRPAPNLDLLPVNVDDQLPASYFVPEFMLVTDDNGTQHVYRDVILPEAQTAIAARERITLKNSVEIVQQLPAPVAVDAEQQPALTGVVMWRNVDPNTDYFTIFMGGFSNGYQIAVGPNDKPLIWRKTIAQQFWRPGDNVDEREREIRRRGEPRWIYRADGDTSANPQDLPKTDTAAE